MCRKTCGFKSHLRHHIKKGDRLVSFFYVAAECVNEPHCGFTGVSEGNNIIKVNDRGSSPLHVVVVDHPYRLQAELVEIPLVAVVAKNSFGASGWIQSSNLGNDNCSFEDLRHNISLSCLRLKNF